MKPLFLMGGMAGHKNSDFTGCSLPSLHLIPSFPPYSPSFLQLITDTIHDIIVHGSKFSSTEGFMTLTNRIAAVHVIYSFLCEEFHWFGQLTAQHPGIVSNLSQMSPGKENNVGDRAGFF